MAHAETWRGIFRTDYPQKVHNLVKATIEALGEMRSPLQVAQNRGVSLEKVYNG